MNPNIFDEIDDRYIAEAANAKRRSRRPYWVGAVAAALALIIGLSALFGGGVWPNATTGGPLLQFSTPGSTPGTTHSTVPGTTTSTAPMGPVIPTSPSILELAELAASPVYPKMAPYVDFTTDMSAYEAWEKDQAQQYDQPDGYADSLHNFFIRSIKEFLSDAGTENIAYSPLNVYMTLAALAECTDGRSRQQILDLLQLDSLEDLRTQVSHVWNAHYCSDGRTSSLLANSLWLDNDYGYRPETVQTLANNYYASVYHGDMGSAAMNEALQTWLNQQTEGLVTEHAQYETLDPNTVFSIASTLLFRAGWEDIFFENRTTARFFHGAVQDEATQFMYNFYTTKTYYRGDNFGAINLELSSGSMMLILPDEGYTPQDLLDSEACIRMSLDHANWDNVSNHAIDLWLPKFDITSNIDLKDGLRALGITDIFDWRNSDFSPLVSDFGGDMWVDRMNHAVRVAIDEKGVCGVSYTHSPIALPIPLYLVFDRPFMFIIISDDNLPLYAGIVNEP